MDIAAFKVSHSVGSDKDATALPAARARSVSIGVCEKGGEGVQPMRAGGGNGGNVTEGLTCKRFARNHPPRFGRRLS